MLRILLLSAFLGVLVVAAGASRTPAAPPSGQPIVVIAHRGAHKDVPENTLAALDRAIQLGCDYVEVDVRRTKDGTLVIMHDATVKRTTNGTAKVSDLTLEEIQKLDVKVRRGSPPAIHKVPTFDAILERAKGRMKIYVDHKDAPPSEVLAAIKKYGMLKDVIVYGSVPTLREYKKLEPSIWIMPNHPPTVEIMERWARDFKPETLDGSVVAWTKEQVDAAHRLGSQVWVDFPADQNNVVGIQSAIKIGVDAIQTDDPAFVLHELGKMGFRPPAR